MGIKTAEELVKNILLFGLIALVCAICFSIFNCSAFLSTKIGNKGVLTTAEESEMPDVVRNELIAQRKRENEEWTSKNISDHPELFLEFAKKTIAECVKEYDARIIDVRTQINQTNRKIKNASDDCEKQEAFLAEANKVKSNTELVFPIEFHGLSLSETQFTNMIASATEKAAFQKKAIDVHQKHFEKLQAIEKNLIQACKDAERELNDLKIKLLEVQSKKIIQGMEDIKDKVDSIVDRALTIDAALSVVPPIPDVRNTLTEKTP